MKTHYNFILFVLLSLIAGASYAQKVITTEGTYQLRIEKNISEETAINKAREKAKINAIENAFGTLVFQGNSVYVKDVQSGETTKTDMVFTSIADVLVNGEWLNTIDEKITFNEYAKEFVPCPEAYHLLFPYATPVTKVVNIVEPRPVH